MGAATSAATSSSAALAPPVAGTAGEPVGRVFVKLVGGSSSSGGSTFEAVPVFAGDTVGDLILRASVKLKWSVGGSRADLYLVKAGGGEEPSSDEAAKAVVAEKRLHVGWRLSSERARIASGAWVVVACPLDPSAAAPAGGSGGGGGSAAGTDADVLTEDRCRTIVREELRAARRRDVEVSIAKAILEDMNGLFDHAGCYGATIQCAGAVPQGFLPELRPFDWSRGEGPSTADACALLAQHLAAAGVPVALSLNVQLGRFEFSGGTDAVIIPSTQYELFPMQQARLVVDFKVPAEIGFEDVKGQAMAELLTANSLSPHHDVMVVFTDLSTCGHALRAEGGLVLVWEGMDVRQTVLVMARFLTGMCAPVGVPSIADDRVPGDPESKKRRKVFHDKVRDLKPTCDALMEQLSAFPSDSIEDYLDRRDIIFSALGLTESE